MEIQSSQLDIAVTGSARIGHGTRSIWSLLRDSFARAEREIIIAAYSLSEASPEFFDLLEGCLIKGIRVLLIINRFGNQPKNAKNNLIVLQKKYKKIFIIKDFNPQDHREDLHAKLIVIDHKIALVGSANPTWKGMIINHELMVRIRGKHASEIGNLVDKLSYYPDTSTISVEKSDRCYD